MLCEARAELITAHHDNLSIHEDKARGVYVKGLTDVYVGSEEEVYKVMQAGSASRSTSATSKLACLDCTLS
jgi:kinesin family protein 5